MTDATLIRSDSRTCPPAFSMPSEALATAASRRALVARSAGRITSRIEDVHQSAHGAIRGGQQEASSIDALARAPVAGSWSTRSRAAGLRARDSGRRRGPRFSGSWCSPRTSRFPWLGIAAGEMGGIALADGGSPSRRGGGRALFLRGIRSRSRLRRSSVCPHSQRIEFLEGAGDLLLDARDVGSCLAGHGLRAPRAGWSSVCPRSARGMPVVSLDAPGRRYASTISIPASHADRRSRTALDPPAGFHARRASRSSGSPVRTGSSSPRSRRECRARIRLQRTGLDPRRRRSSSSDRPAG